MADLRLSLTGAVDLATAPALLAELQRAIECSVANIVVDCNDVTFIDSTGLYVLEEAQRALRAQRREMHLVNVARSPDEAARQARGEDLTGVQRAAEEEPAAEAKSEAPAAEDKGDKAKA